MLHGRSHSLVRSVTSAVEVCFFTNENINKIFGAFQALQMMLFEKRQEPYIPSTHMDFSLRMRSFTIAWMHEVQWYQMFKLFMR